MSIIDALKPMETLAIRDIRAWLWLIGETDLSIINDVVEYCKNDDDAMEYYVGRANNGN